MASTFFWFRWNHFFNERTYIPLFFAKLGSDCPWIFRENDVTENFQRRWKCKKLMESRQIQSDRQNSPQPLEPKSLK